MKIFGIGTDIVNIKRMDKSLKRNNYKNLSYKTLIHRQKYLYDLYL